MNIIPIPLGLSMGPVLLPFVNAYLVRSGDGWVVVDTGPPGCARRVLAALRRHGIPGKSVRLILLTHGHFDHTGSAVELQRLLPGHPRIAMHPGDGPFVTEERLPLSLRPTSLTGAFSFLGGTVGMLLWTLAATLRPWPDPVLQEVLWLDEVSA
ncbi:MAG TPA: MBL fold metallo-hydrolase, partial [Armatimonadota bacterium]|nr:MBL fold metallo-hydrolase [Armatimonadota bacterium]